MTAKDINDIIKTLCPNDDDFEKPIISPAYLKNELEALALEQEPYEDCISRQAVFAETYNWSKDEFLKVTNPFDYLRKRINSLSPVTPARKIGHWVNNQNSTYTCNICGCKHSRSIYCPNCGAKMQASPAVAKSEG